MNYSIYFNRIVNAVAYLYFIEKNEVAICVFEHTGLRGIWGAEITVYEHIYRYCQVPAFTLSVI